MSDIGEIRPVGGPKLAIVSHTVPPSSGGQAMLIYRLFADHDPASYCVISQRVEDSHDFAGSALPELAGRYYRLPSDPGSRVKSKVSRGFTLPAAFRARSAAIARVARDEGCEAIVVFTGDLLNLPAAARASRTTRIPYYVYVCDYYSQQWVNRVFGYVARRIEPHVLRGAAAVIVPNEFMRDELRREFGVRAQVIHHFCDLSQYGPAPTRSLAGRLNVVYTGAVSPAQSDALQNAARATELMSAEGAAFHLFTGQSADVLLALGVEGPYVRHPHEPASAIPSIQRAADILFLPLSFASPYPSLVRTAAPFKMGEYLASRRPVLVHAPRDSYLSWYFRRHECGVVVDEPDVEKLAAAILRLSADQELAKGLVARGWERARLDFDSVRGRLALAEVLQRPEGGAGGDLPS